jgi:N-acetylglutamate synthase-like GNAT family acetyltransferase
LDLFDRYQKVEKQWCNKNGNWTLINKGYIIDWDKDKKEGKIQQLSVILKNKSGNVFGAYKNNNLIGFSVILNDKFGTNTQYVKLHLLHVSNGYRHKGIGKRLFRKCVEKAKEINAEKIYICANNSEETQGFYLSMGCKDAMEIDDKSYEAERFERHLEYIIK